MSAGDKAALPAMTLRAAPVELVGSGRGGPAGLDVAAKAFDDLLELATNGEIVIDIETVPLAAVEKIWPTAGSDRRIVFVP